MLPGPTLVVKSPAMFTNSGLDETQPHLPAASGSETQPIELRDRRRRPCRWLRLLLLMFLILCAVIIFPGRSNVLIIGLDRAPEGTKIARSDSLILTSYQPQRPSIAILSIPRDLWVEIPGVGFNRINTAHYFAENAQPGTGPLAAMAAVERNFNVVVDDFIRVDFAGVASFVDALGGVPITLETPVGKLPAGEQVLTGEQALAFVRDRSGTDDFFRMAHGQQFVQAVLSRLLQPGAWPRIPAALVAMSENFESSMNVIERMRFGITLLRVGPESIATHQITREMTTGFITDQGAQVLDPNWDLIHPLVHELFGSR